jgi:hypothetical protein
MAFVLVDTSNRIRADGKGAIAAALDTGRNIRFGASSIQW